MKVLDDLQADPYAFSLYAALRALDALNPGQPRLGEAQRAGAEFVRLSQPAYLEFVASELASVRREARWQIGQYTFGVFGPNGALPLHLTEFAAARARHHDDPAVRDFINLFHHRLTALFYRAWAESEPVAQADRPDADRFHAALAALVGLDTPAASGRDCVDDDAKVARPGLLLPVARSADGLETLLEDYFGLDAEVRAYVPRWLDIPADARLRLGRVGDSGGLGTGATLGTSTLQANHSFEIVIGPVEPGELHALLPGTPALEALRDLVGLYTNDEWEWQLRILVPRDRIVGSTLGAEAFYGRALADSEATYGADSLEVAACLDQLATLHYVNGRYAEAEPQALRSLAIRALRLGEAHPDTVASRERLVVVARSQRELERGAPRAGRRGAISAQVLRREGATSARLSVASDQPTVAAFSHHAVLSDARLGLTSWLGTPTAAVGEIVIQGDRRRDAPLAANIVS